MDMRGHFVFCLSGTKSWKQFYGNSGIETRLCFADMDISDNIQVSAPSPGNFVFFNMHIWTAHFNPWKYTLPKFTAKNLITRIYEVNEESLWRKALHSGASILATNKVSNHPWAKVADIPFASKMMNL